MILVASALVLAVVLAAAVILVTAGAHRWSQVAKGHLIEIEWIEPKIPSHIIYGYSEDHAAFPSCETILRFADGGEYRVPGFLADPGHRGYVELERNWLGFYRFAATAT